MPREHVVRETWYRATGKGSVSQSVIRGLLKLFPGLPENLLTIPVYDSFQKLQSEIDGDRARWQDAQYLYAASREVLVSAAKTYYASVDGTPEFALIGRPEWLLETPQPLTEHDPVAELDLDSYNPSPPKLAGLNCDWLSFKRRFMPTTAPLFDGDSYRVTGIDTEGNGRLAFKFGPSSYFKYVNSCESLGAEFAAAYEDKADFTCPLPLRGAPEQIFNLRQRHAVAGVNCILLIRHYTPRKQPNAKARDVFVLHRRGTNTLEAQNTWHVIPAGTHQPALGFGFTGDSSVWRTAVREFIEELCDPKETIKFKNLGEDFLGHPFVDHLVSVYFRNTGAQRPAASIHLLGVGFDPLTTKPEILAAIVLDWRRVDRELMKNWEGEEDTPLRYVDVECLATWAESSPIGSILPAGQACMVLADRNLPSLWASVRAAP